MTHLKPKETWVRVDIEIGDKIYHIFYIFLFKQSILNAQPKNNKLETKTK